MSTKLDNNLYLYSTNLNYFPDDFPEFIYQCQSFNFIGELAANLGENHFHVGDRFLEMISFLGCSPFIKIHPDNDYDTNYCSIYIPDQLESIRFINTNDNKGPRCPDCRKLVKNASYLWVDWKPGNEKKVLQCEHCNISFMLQDMDWRKNAGIVSFAVKISNIFPKEAIPTDQLMKHLKILTNVEWKYFYA